MASLRAPGRLAEAVPEESALLDSVRARVGPYASEEALRRAVRGAHSKVHWAANAYLRLAVTTCAEAGRADFEPAQPEAAAPPNSDAAEPVGGAALPPLPQALWEAILGRLTAPDVRNVACVCSWLRTVASSQTLWEALFHSRWGALTHPPLPCWRASYAARAAQLGALRCPACCGSRLMPVVYGFPSVALVEAQRAGRVLLGGDYLHTEDPAWACGLCGEQWRTWPWAVGGIPPPVRMEARAAPAGAGTGLMVAT